jgi:hypothetical protein
MNLIFERLDAVGKVGVSHGLPLEKVPFWPVVVNQKGTVLRRLSTEIF